MRKTNMKEIGKKPNGKIVKRCAYTAQAFIALFSYAWNHSAITQYLNTRSKATIITNFLDFGCRVSIKMCDAMQSLHTQKNTRHSTYIPSSNLEKNRQATYCARWSVVSIAFARLRSIRICGESHICRSNNKTAFDLRVRFEKCMLGVRNVNKNAAGRLEGVEGGGGGG
jgi:hypothetical protein